MKCSVFIAASVDGYIAASDGSVDWLQSAGNSQADMGSEDMGFRAFIESVDCMIMGRKCMETIASMDLTPEQWPYGDLRIVVLSNSLTQPPKSLCDRVEIYSGDLRGLLDQLAAEGLHHAYIDGGSTITSFLNERLIDEITITQAPILLGAGIPLFGEIRPHLNLTRARAISYANDFVQVKYDVSYA